MTLKKAGIIGVLIALVLIVLLYTIVRFESQEGDLGEYTEITVSVGEDNENTWEAVDVTGRPIIVPFRGLDGIEVIKEKIASVEMPLDWDMWTDSTKLVYIDWLLTEPE